MEEVIIYINKKSSQSVVYKQTQHIIYTLAKYAIGEKAFVLLVCMTNKRINFSKSQQSRIKTADLGQIKAYISYPTDPSWSYYR